MKDVREYQFVDVVRSVMVSIVAIILFFTIIGIPLSLGLMQMERIIQMLAKPKEVSKK